MEQETKQTLADQHPQGAEITDNAIPVPDIVESPEKESSLSAPECKQPLKEGKNPSVADKKAAAQKLKTQESEAERKKAEQKAEQVEKAARLAAEKKAKEEAPYVEIAYRYAPHYPNCAQFHITSDKMVFLEPDKAAAIEHQNFIGKGEVRTIKVQ